MNTVHRHNGWIAAAAALSAIACPVTGSAAEDGRFKKLSVYLERNVQDHDAEIRFEATGTADGLAALKVSAPGERTVIDVRTPDSKLGIRSLTVESPEPSDDGVVRADFPAGAYRFEGTTTNGASLRGEALLSHATAAVYASNATLPFAQRLIEALQAGENAGGDKRGKQGAALLIYATEDYAALDLRVDDHPEPLAELHRLLEKSRERFQPFVSCLPRRGNPAGITDRAEIEAVVARFQAARQSGTS